jgi:hypothetical protein
MNAPKTPTRAETIERWIASEPVVHLLELFVDLLKALVDLFKPVVDLLVHSLELVVDPIEAVIDTPAQVVEVAVGPALGHQLHTATLLGSMSCVVCETKRLRFNFRAACAQPSGSRARWRRSPGRDPRARLQAAGSGASGR